MVGLVSADLCRSRAAVLAQPAHSLGSIRPAGGRPVENGMDLVLKKQTSHFFVPGVKQANFQASYSLSRYVSQVADSDFVNTATDYNNPDRFTGPNALDRKNQVSFGGTFDLPWFFQLGVIGHFYSPLPQSAVFSPSAGG